MLAASRLTGLASAWRPLWLAGVIVLIAPLVGRTYLHRRRELSSLSALARRRNLKFSTVDLIGLHDRYCNLELVRQGHNRHVWNVLYGSADAGLVTVFRYSYDLGFGVCRRSESWWMTVLEGPQVLKPWRADPAGAAEISPPSERMGPFAIHADHAATVADLRQPGIRTAIESMPADCHIEAAGLLLAAAIPFEAGPAAPDTLLTCILTLADHLQTAGRVVSRPPRMES